MARRGQGSDDADKFFHSDAVFRFYSKSKHVLPGKGTGETVPSHRVCDFHELSEIKDWRKKLSNFWISEMEIDGLKWASVEHFYHANKYKENCPRFYRRFSLSYGPQEGDPAWLNNLPENVATDPAVAKALGGKTGKYKRVPYRPKDLMLDNGFFDKGNSERVMKVGQMAKYRQSKELRMMLLATKDAMLTHFVRGSPPVLFYDTMEVRRLLRVEAEALNQNSSVSGNPRLPT